MNEEKKETNSLGTVAMVFSILGLLFCVTIFLIPLGILFLLLGLLLGIIALFFRPRGKAWVAVIIPAVLATIVGLCVNYFMSSVKTPLNEFIDRARVEFNSEKFENIDQDQFEAIAKVAFTDLAESYSGEDLRQIIENTTGSNTLEKGAYFITNFLKEGYARTLEMYDNNVSLSDQSIDDEDLETLSDDEDNTDTEDEVLIDDESEDEEISVEDEEETEEENLDDNDDLEESSEEE